MAAAIIELSMQASAPAAYFLRLSGVASGAVHLLTASNQFGFERRDWTSTLRMGHVGHARTGYARLFFLGTILLIAAALVRFFRLMLFLITGPKRRGIARMINSIRWKGTEQVLDVGCGKGLVLLAAAKHLVDGEGTAIGIDIWNEMAGRQNAETLTRNAEVEGVADRIEVQEADAQLAGIQLNGLMFFKSSVIALQQRTR